jgi:hypothetical protein
MPKLPSSSFSLQASSMATVASASMRRSTAMALGQQPVGFSELADDLLRGVASSLHGVLLPIGRSDSHTRTKLRGSGHEAQRASVSGMGQ